MNPKPIILTAWIAVSAAFCQAANAQAAPLSDLGISTHNYKHPNKAAAAPKARLVVESSNPALAARFATLYVGRYTADHTPKYAPREVRFVVFTRQRRQGTVINPLLSARNYKTGNGVRVIKPVQQEEWICGAM